MGSMWACHTHKGNGWELKFLAGVGRFIMDNHSEFQVHSHYSIKVIHI